jgi:RNA polymerase subunit RPABC4/transcription elongation factor Spt4
MIIEETSAIRLEEAYFCLNCEVVTNCINICPTCGQKKVWPLRNWLGSVIALENSRHKEGILIGMKN